MSLHDLQERLGHHFAVPELLVRALTHASYGAENADATDLERLEFLGDAVFNLVVAETVFERFPHEPEGVLSRMAHSLRSTSALARMARTIHLGPHIRLGRGADMQRAAERDSVLADATEAVFGAVMRDAGLDAVRDVVRPLLAPLVAEVERRLARFGPAGVLHPKNALQEILQRDGSPAPTYEVLAEEGPHHDRAFVVAVEHAGRRLGVGRGPSKQAAHTAAAEEALVLLETP